MTEVWDKLDTLSTAERQDLFASTVGVIRKDTETLAQRLGEAGWVFHMDAVVRPDDLRHHDTEAVLRAEELLGHALPGFLKEFVLEVGVIFLGGYAREQSPLASTVEVLTGREGVAEYAPLDTIPLPTGIDELEMAVEEEFDQLCIPIIEDSYTAAGFSGGPPRCLIFDAEQPEALDLYADFEPDEPMGIDLVRYIRTCLRQGGFFDAAEPFLLELGDGLGEF